MLRPTNPATTRLPTLSPNWTTVGFTLSERRRPAAVGNGSLMDLDLEVTSGSFQAMDLEDPSFFDSVLLNDSPRSSTMTQERLQENPGKSHSGDSTCIAEHSPKLSRIGSRTNRKTSAARGFTLMETLIAFLVSTIGVNVIYNSLNNVGRNSLDTMNRQGAASALESAHEAVKRINSVSEWIRLDTSWVDLQQGVPYRVHVTGAPVDSNSTTASCVKPGPSSLMLAKVTYSVSRNAEDQIPSHDSLVASTVLSQQ